MTSANDTAAGQIAAQSPPYAPCGSQMPHAACQNVRAADLSYAPSVPLHTLREGLRARHLHAILVAHTGFPVCSAQAAQRPGGVRMPTSNMPNTSSAAAQPFDAASVLPEAVPVTMPE